MPKIIKEESNVEYINDKYIVTYIYIQELTKDEYLDSVDKARKLYHALKTLIDDKRSWERMKYEMYKSLTYDEKEEYYFRFANIKQYTHVWLF